MAGGGHSGKLHTTRLLPKLQLTYCPRVVAIVVGFSGFLLFLFVPETFWDRAPVPRKSRKGSRPGFFRRYSSKHDIPRAQQTGPQAPEPPADVNGIELPPASPVSPTRPKNVHRVGFVPDVEARGDTQDAVDEKDRGRGLGALDGPSFSDVSSKPHVAAPPPQPYRRTSHRREDDTAHPDTDTESQSIASSRNIPGSRPTYTNNLRGMPAKTFIQQLRPWHGRLNKDKWYKVAVRPLILFSYPAVLWSSIVYSCSVGWLIVISESVAVIYREGTYQFNALQTGLVYISPFVGGVLGSAIAGKVSDIIVKAMARRNGGLYEPEFRLVMAIPVAFTTVIGLIGFGWSAQLGNHWIVPTVFFGVISFGCTLGSTTSITFCVDSYRQYAGEALVTLNFSKNIFHGLVFSLFVTGWLTEDGPRTVFIWIGIIQLILLFSTIPMYIFGKRARMWTVRKNFMEKF